MKQLSDWRWENDEHVLRRAMIAGVSYPEYVVIVHRLRELTQKGDSDISWESQDIGDGLIEDLTSHEGQLRALFVHGSPFRDNIIYAEYKKLWLATADERQRLTVTCPDTIDERVWLQFTKNCGSDELTDENINTHWASACLTTATKMPNEQFMTVLDDAQRTIIKESVQVHTRLTDWAKTTEPAFALMADVEQGVQEKELIERLMSVGAQITDNRLQIEDYHRAGKRFSLPLGNGRLLNYVPHESIGTRELQRYKHTLTWNATDDALEHVRDRIRESFEAHRVTAADVLVTIDHYDRVGLRPRVQLAQRNRLGPKRREAMEQAATDGELVRLGEETKWARHTTVLFATDDRLRRFPGYYTEIEPGSFMYHHAARARERLLESVQLLKDLTFHITFEAEFDDPPQRGVGGAAEDVWKLFRSQLQQTINGLGLEPQVAKDTINMLSLAGIEALFEHTTKSVVRREEIVHDAPYSERGVLRIENAQPDDGLTVLAELGIISAVCEEVPYEPIYRGRHRRGRVLPWHPDYALGVADLTMPDNNVIMHGMTGIGAGVNSAISRLETIITTGGVKSISERRRMGIEISGTMSPVGDTGSGIDVGVPTRISALGSPGSTIYFVMKPTCIFRRDLFFSNTDFGGSESRYESYNNYAATIGQGKMHHVAPHNARQKHLKEGLSGSNELYLRYEIPWDEVDVLLVASGVRAQVDALVEKYQALGELPGSLCVKTINEQSLATSIKEWVGERSTERAVCV